MTDPAAHCMKTEFVIVTGAEDHYSDKQRHNKMMFAQSAVRYARRWGSYFDRTTVFSFNGRCVETRQTEDGSTYFHDGHTSAQIAAFKTSIKATGSVFREVSDWGQVASHINNRDDLIDGCKKHVQALIFFCHGTPHHIWLSNSRREYLTRDKVSAVSPASFLPEMAVSARFYKSRHVTSWACQTANGSDPGSFDDTVAASLAQHMADTWDIAVYASATRTLYKDVFSGGVSGRWKDVTGSRRMIDGCLWEDDGADGLVSSGPKGDHGNLQQGMWKIEPGQRTGYTRSNHLD